jgi:predicted small metal-binding protein
MSTDMAGDAEAMSLIITCECGYDIRGDSESSLIARAREHLQANHPAIASDASDADLLDMATMDSRSDPA